MMKPITEETRLALIADCKAHIKHLQECIERRYTEWLEIKLQLAQIALASLEAEPVATRCRYHSAPQSNGLWLYIPQEAYSPDNTGNYQEQALYTAQPVPVMQPVDLRATLNPSMFNNDVIFGYRKARDEDIAAIRAAGGEVKL